MYESCIRIPFLIMTELTRSIQDSKTCIDFVQGPPGSHRKRVNLNHRNQILNIQGGFSLILWKKFEQLLLFREVKLYVSRSKW